MLTGPIFMLSGSPGSGKSSAARALAMRYPFGMHIPLDDLREWVVSGVAHPVPTWTDETTRQFHLARSGAGRLARLYAEAGFAVVLDDVIFPPDFEKSIAPQLAGLAVVRVLLLLKLSRREYVTRRSWDRLVTLYRHFASRGLVAADVLEEVGE